MMTSATRYRTTGDASATTSDLLARFDAIRTELDVPAQFPAEVLAEAEQAAAQTPHPDRDDTDAPFVTIDPVGSMDLDQAMLLERAPGGAGGYRVRYAIADVPAFVRPGGALDAETRLRGQTIYCPDQRTPLHPPVLSEAAASLLEGADRPAFVWDIALDADGRTGRVDVYRSMVRSTARLDYDSVQRDIDAGTAPEALMLLKEIGEKRIALEQERGGASLPMPEQDVHEDPAGVYSVTFRPIVASEDWNAQISLLTGMAAADLMLTGNVGILRTMPAPAEGEMARFQRKAKAAGIPWPHGLTYGQFLRTLDRTDPRHLALIHQATRLFRGAGYTPFDGAAPEQRTHAAVAAPYAHVTAPLRRLVDRFGLVVCQALSAGAEMPDWCRQSLPTIPEIMQSTDRRASAVERACTDAVEAAVLRDRVGQSFPAWVLDAPQSQHGGPAKVLVQINDPAVVDYATGSAEPGEQVTVTVAGADIAAGTVDLSVVADPARP